MQEINYFWGKEWFQFIKDNSDKPWDFRLLSKNPNITWDIVQANPDKPWNFNYLSENPNITWDIVQANPNKPWNFDWLSLNITWDFVKANPNKPWDFDYLSKNPNITWDIVQANPDKHWNFDYLSAHKMSVAKEKYIEQMTRSVDIISDWFLDLKTDPTSKLCQKWMAQIQSEYYDIDPWKQ